MKLNRRGMFSLLGGTGLLLMAGCGGGGSVSTTGSVTRATQERVGSVVRKLFSGGTMFGAVDGMGAVRDSVALGSSASAPPPTATQGYANGDVPQLGAFLKNMMQNGPGSRAKKVTRAEGDPAGMTIAPWPWWGEAQDYTYYDYYLGLWAQVSQKDSQTKTALFEDEALTKSAGEILSTWPTDWETFPQVWKSSYKFTAGFLKGAYGSSENITNAGWSSGSSKYENVYADGWKDKGESNWGSGGSSWFNRSESADGKVWNESAGSWRSTGAGGTRMSTSDGYEAVFTHNSDGSGRGTVKEKGQLIATITWDNQGNVTIYYNDFEKTVERFNRWGIYYGGGGGVTMPMTLAGDGSVRSDTATANTPG
jgi:hypothetical protein